MRGRRDVRALRGPLAAVVLAGLGLGLGACSEEHPERYRQSLKLYISDTLRAHRFFVKLTDEDNRPRPPTKYSVAGTGVVYALRHNVTLDDTKVTLSTWVYKDKKAMEAARKEGIEVLTDDLKKEGILFKVAPLESDKLHAILIMEGPTPSMANTFEMLYRDLAAGVGGIKQDEK